MTHIYIDERVVSTTMMSNTTLDAAKTSRMVQLLQTQANQMDLNQLVRGLLTDTEDGDIQVRMLDYKLVF